MRYFGGKARIGKQIAEVVNSYLTNKKDYFEPFVGGAWVTQYIWNGCRSKTCADINPYLIEFYKSLQDNKFPPKDLTKEQYNYIKMNKDENMALTGFVGFGCSFAGKWFGGFASSPKRNYCLNAYNSVMKKKPSLNRVTFVCSPYQNFNPINSVIYCDPPYANTTKYDYCPNFNSEEFWEIMRKWSKNNTVLISEYTAPSDFVCIKEFITKTDIRSKDNTKLERIERLFTK
jgi:DNA adenine methylase